MSEGGVLQRVMIIGGEILDEGVRRDLAKEMSLDFSVVGSYREAMELLAVSIPDLVIIDLTLPDRSGLELIEALEGFDVGIQRILILTPAGVSCHEKLRDPDLNLLERPLVPKALRSFVRSPLTEPRKHAHTTFLSLGDGIRFATCAGQSLLIEVSMHGYPLGQILIWRGDLLGARDFYGAGVDAIRRLLREEVEAIHYESLEEDSAKDEGSGLPRRLSASWTQIALGAPLDVDEILLDDPLLERDEMKKGGTLMGVAPVEPMEPMDPMAEGAGARGGAGDGDEAIFIDGLDEPWDRLEVASPRDARDLHDHKRQDPLGSFSPGAHPEASLLEVSEGASGGSGVDFKALVNRGVEALLDRNFILASEMFLSAQKIRPGDGYVRANLERLRELGHVSDEDLK